MIITIRELNHLNTIITDIYKYVNNIDINNGYIIIYFNENPKRILKECLPYNNESLKEILKILIKVLDNDFEM